MQIFYSPHHRQHTTGYVLYEGQPTLIEEVPARAEILLQAVSQARLGPVLPPTDFGLAPLTAVHDRDFVDFLQHAHARMLAYERSLPLDQQSPDLTNLAVFPDTFARRGRRRSAHIVGQIGQYSYGLGAPILAGTWQAAYWSAQCALSAAEWVKTQPPNPTRPAAAYAICRPPGHHATANLFGGFCYLNNAAIAARWLGQPIAILDIDYHHGNGTQEIFYQDPHVLFVSLHADPDTDYPFFWGGADERGEGAGLGTNHNFPLSPGTEDDIYLATLDEALEVIRAFNPSYLVVSAGFDTAQGDPVGGFGLTPAGLAEVGRRIAALSLPTVIVQEGGYLLERLAENALAFLRNFNPNP